MKTVLRLARVLAVLAVCLTIAVAAGTALAASGAPPAAKLPGGAIALGALTWLAGVVVKKWEGAANWLIGWVVFGLSLLGYAVIPAEANAAGFLAGALGPLKSMGVLLGASLQTVLVTGIHQWFLGSVIEPLAGKRTKTTNYLPAR